ncbi:hypothetical protein TNCV_1666221 [Trichonephila clavipes]|nr:hypothetical protein TNCV_1666221 [Trichonephila clavipes]
MCGSDLKANDADTWNNGDVKGLDFGSVPKTNVKRENNKNIETSMDGKVCQKAQEGPEPGRSPEKYQSQRDVLNLILAL